MGYYTIVYPLRLGTLEKTKKIRVQTEGLTKRSDPWRDEQKVLLRCTTETRMKVQNWDLFRDVDSTILTPKIHENPWFCHIDTLSLDCFHTAFPLPKSAQQDRQCWLLGRLAPAECHAYTRAAWHVARSMENMEMSLMVKWGTRYTMV